MKKRTPFEQQLAEDLEHLQLPDEDQAWAAMQRLLDKNDNDRPPVAAPLFMKGCGGWAALLILVLLAGGAAWYFLGGSDGKEKIGKSGQHNAKETGSVPSIALPGSSTSGQTGENSKTSNSPSTLGDSSVKTANVNGNTNTRDNENTGQGSNSHPGREEASVNRAKVGGKASNENRTTDDAYVTANSKKKNSSTKARTNTEITPPLASKTDDEGVGKVNEDVDHAVVKQEQEYPAERMDITLEPTKKVHDSLVLTKVADTSRADSVVLSKKESQDSTRRKKLSFAAGLALQHALTFNGTETGLKGKKPYRNDYLPSVYLRLHRGKWFLQTEFRYGAPQNVNGFTYRTISQDTVQGVSFATSYNLRKTYYHQVPLSLHYTIKPGWSIGAGVVYNRFTGTISEKSLRLSVSGTPVDTILEKNLVDAKYDSAFARNTWQWMAESQYKWKRFSIGARYASGLQPFIRYRDPAGVLRSKRHQSLNVFIRFELWRSRK